MQVRFHYRLFTIPEGLVMMKMRRNCHDDTDRGARRPWKKWRLITAWLVALTIAAIILLAFRQESVDSDTVPYESPGVFQRYDDGGAPNPAD